MTKILHPNQYPALLEYQFESSIYDLECKLHPYLPEPELSKYIQKELEVIHTPNETKAIYYDRTNRDSWDILDKKCRYYRKDYGNGYDYAKRLCDKYLGKTPNEILKLGLSHIESKLRSDYFFKLGLTSYLHYMKDPNSSSCNHVVIDNLVHLKNKIVTTKKDVNLFKYEVIESDLYLKSDSITFNKYLAFITELEARGYEVDIESTCTLFKGKNIQGYVSITPNNYTYDLVFVDYHLFWNKISRCPLVFKIPKSSLGIVSAFKELDYLGTKQAKKELENDSYFPKHVNLYKWWM